MRPFLKKAVLTYIFLFLFFTLLVKSLLHYQAHIQEKETIKQNNIIQETVRERFKIFLDFPLTISLLGAEYLLVDEKLVNDYRPLAHKLIETNPEVLGLNLLDNEGRITKVFPEDENSLALGKTTQNIEALKKSLHNGEPYWFSSPFDLFQKGNGFVFYVPILKKGLLKGWFATVISENGFLDKFQIKQYLESYNLIIKDLQSGSTYMATAMEPDPSVQAYEQKVRLFGRELLFQSWRKDHVDIFKPTWLVTLLGALILTLLTGFVRRLQEQKRKAKEQLNNVSLLLDLTSKEALSYLVELPPESTTHFTHLIEQIDLLQTMAHGKDELAEENQNFTDILINQLETFQDVFDKKNLEVVYDEKKWPKIFVNANAWLLQHSVLSNLLSHAIIHSPLGSKVNIDVKSSDDTHFITFTTQKNAQDNGNALLIDRRLHVAKTVLHLYHGDLFVQNDLQGNLLIRMILPKA